MVPFLNPTARLVLLAIMVASLCTGGRVNTMDAYMAYVRLAGEAGFKPVTTRQFNNILNELGRLGVVDRRVRSIGRYGKMSTVAVKDPELILSELKEDLALGELAEKCDALFFFTSGPTAVGPLSSPSSSKPHL